MSDHSYTNGVIIPDKIIRQGFILQLPMKGGKEVILYKLEGAFVKYQSLQRIAWKGKLAYTFFKTWTWHFLFLI